MTKQSPDTPLVGAFCLRLKLECPLPIALAYQAHCAPRISQMDRVMGRMPLTQKAFTGSVLFLLPCLTWAEDAAAGALSVSDAAIMLGIVGVLVAWSVYEGLRSSRVPQKPAPHHSIIAANAPLVTPWQANAENCPFCSAPMSLRTAKAGKSFYGCSRAPVCRGTKLISHSARTHGSRLSNL
ncbi:hypothetical protein GM154_04225 [Pseudomonas sp. MAG002Y]|nr:hypothetical protein [Pseudomonas sp. MAG002Y]